MSFALRPTPKPYVLRPTPYALSHKPYVLRPTLYPVSHNPYARALSSKPLQESFNLIWDSIIGLWVESTMLEQVDATLSPHSSLQGGCATALTRTGGRGDSSRALPRT
eukprot:CAMPEP_0182907304 /NCGR_PEP_ID=MMETSP0034_2-20130328/34399_1 /TAXON_ID=156128 /ORGANISM="Nephroselmis pyriformis, Strain CCMP717" /LENGTH=107 /DNA_ID=CAMNT_0025043207 /DNA_START=217 /DNA_END=538 /DNA_ORIENTATION=-